MRTLFPTPLAGGRFAGLQPVSDEPLLFIRCFCEARVAMVEQSFIKAFLKTDRAPDANEPLVSCWIRVAEMFTQLQTQLSRVHWCDPKHNSLVGNVHDESYMEAHRCQFSESKAGKPIGLVVSPFLQLFGNEDGDRYHKHRTVSKAVVLVHDDEDFEEVVVVEPVEPGEQMDED